MAPSVKPLPSKRRLTVQLPEELYFRVHQAALLTNRPVSDYVAPRDVVEHPPHVPKCVHFSACA